MGADLKRKESRKRKREEYAAQHGISLENVNESVKARPKKQKKDASKDMNGASKSAAAEDVDKAEPTPAADAAEEAEETNSKHHRFIVFVGE